MKTPTSHYVIHGNSMLPNLKEGEHVFTFNWFLKLKKGDIVVVKLKNRLIIKRIFEIRNQEVFLKGDKSNKSTDSRDFGWVAKKDILGKVICVF